MRPDQHKQKQSAKYKKKHGMKDGGGKNVPDSKKTQGVQKNDRKASNPSLSEGDKRGISHPSQSCSSTGGANKADQRCQQEVEESKLFRRRQVLTNWDRYEESERALEEDDTIIVRGADFSQLLNNAGDAISQFRLKAEAEWDAEIAEGSEQSALSLDLAGLAGALQCVPLHHRLRLPEHLFQEEQLAAFNKDAEENALRWQEGERTKSPPDVESDVQDDNTTQELGTSDNQLDILDDILNDHDDSSSNKLLQQNTKPVPADKEAAQQNGDDVDDLDDLLNMDSSVATAKVVSEVVSKAVPDADADDLDDLLSGTTSKSGGAVNTGQAETTTDGKSNVFKPAVTENLDDWLDSMLDD